jgi:Regulator of chromosome condensation (RCC1) repeat
VKTRAANSILSPLLLLVSYGLLTAGPAGSVVGWGDDRSGVVTGVASPGNATGIVTVAGQLLTDVVAVCAGRDHALALRSDGTVAVLGDQFSVWTNTSHGRGGS